MTAQRRLTQLYSRWRKELKKEPPFTHADFTSKGMAALAVGRCPYCTDTLTPENLSPDHVKPLKLGGSWALDNIAFCCIDCNIEKSWNPLEIFLLTKPHKRIGKRYTAKRLARLRRAHAS